MTTAKDFRDEARVRQYNAIRSWQGLHPDVEVILCGQGMGYADAVRDLGLVHTTDVACSESGCPSVGSMFAVASALARHPIRAYLNCDIIVMPDLLQVIEHVRLSRYLLVAQRWDMAVDGEMDYRHGWEHTMRERLAAHGELSRVSAIDMFLYRGDFWDGLPELFVGRASYDNFLLFFCRAHGIPVVDATGAATLIHQTHDYGHVEGGKHTVWFGEEAARNLEAVGGYERMCTIDDASWRLQSGHLARNWARGDSRRWAEKQKDVWSCRRSTARMLPVLLLEGWCELCVRTQRAGRGEVMQLLKYPLWLLLRLLRKR